VLYVDEPAQELRSAVNSWDEFNRLREVIVGDATNARLPPLTDISAWVNCYPTLDRDAIRRIPTGGLPQRIVEETNEDLYELCRQLREAGVTVHRPQPLDHSAAFGSPEWTTSGMSSYSPRDLTLVVGSTLIETPSPMRGRYFELFGMRDLFTDYLLRGARWIAAPRPQLSDGLFALDEEGLPYLTEAEPVFEAANVLRLGRDVLYQVSRSGNELGLRWLESTLALLDDIRVHPLRGVYEYTHIDSTIALLRPGLVMLNPARIPRHAVPAVFRGWDVVWCPEIEPRTTALPYTLSEPWISMNLLMVDPEHAIVDADQPALPRVLEQHGITPIPHRLRHARILGGGFHCVTLDVIRDGGPESYLDR